MKRIREDNIFPKDSRLMKCRRLIGSGRRQCYQVGRNDEEWEVDEGKNKKE
jgi:hypothetical protein